jgi:transposase
LRLAHAANPHPHAVTDQSFTSGNPFFDPHDLVQVKYEMLRRVHQEGQPVTHAAASFGLSRVAFYDAQNAFGRDGLPGLLPQRPGPRRAHKLSSEVVAVLEQAIAREPGIRAPQLARLVQQRFGLVVHPRSIERALERQKKPLDDAGATRAGRT